MTAPAPRAHAPLPQALLLALALLALPLSVGCESDKGETKATPEAPAGEFVPGQTDKPANDGAAAKAEFKGVGKFLPQSDELEGYTLTEGPDYYTKDTLFEIMDGASDGYLAYGFEEMAKAVYKPAEGKNLKEEVNVEVFRFKDKLGALGQFAEERSSCIKTDQFDDNWCLRASDLLFWKGPHMVKVQTFDDSPEAEAAIVEVAKKVEPKVEGDATLPDYAKKLPEEHKLKGSTGYKTRDSYGFSGLNSLFVASYRPEGEAYAGEEDVVTLFAVDKGKAEAAEKLLADVKATLEKDGTVKDNGGVKPLSGVGEEAFVYTDAVGTHTFLRKGSQVAGGRDFKDEATAKAMTDKLASGL